MCEKTKPEFIEKVEYFNTATFGESPSKFSVIGCKVVKNSKPLPIYATYLYDSVMLYAKALANVTSIIDVNGKFSNNLYM